MTTSFFNEPIDQELDLDGLTSIHGGIGPLVGVGLALGLAGGVSLLGIGAASLLKDALNGDELGTTAGDMIGDLVESGGGNGDVDVTTTGS